MTDWSQPESWHPAATIFPLLEGAEFDALVKDIAEHGLLNPLTIHAGLLLDGRNRARACAQAGVMPTTVEWAGADPVAWVIGQNLHRRHMNESARGYAAAQCATLTLGDNQYTRGFANLQTHSQAEAARLFHVSPRSVADGVLVREYGIDELRRLTARGVVAISQAADVAKEDEAIQEQIMRMYAETGKLTEAWRLYKKSLRGSRPLPPGLYRVLYADPPWSYNDQRAGLHEGTDRTTTAAAQHYPTMPTDEICDLSVPTLAHSDAVLFCWATFPLLPDALQVIRAWGFTYKTGFVWAKPRGSFGHYHKADAELLLLATRGSGTPDAEDRASQIVRAATEGHSRKPELFRDLITRLYTHGPYIELFARTSVPGWTCWGNEP